jgi:hypothetical protein
MKYLTTEQKQKAHLQQRLKDQDQVIQERREEQIDRSVRTNRAAAGMYKSAIECKAEERARVSCDHAGIRNPHLIKAAQEKAMATVRLPGGHLLPPPKNLSAAAASVLQVREYRKTWMNR